MIRPAACTSARCSTPSRSHQGLLSSPEMLTFLDAVLRPAEAGGAMKAAGTN